MSVKSDMLIGVTGDQRRSEVFQKGIQDGVQKQDQFVVKQCVTNQVEIAEPDHESVHVSRSIEYTSNKYIYNELPLKYIRFFVGKGDMDSYETQEQASGSGGVVRWPS